MKTLWLISTARNVFVVVSCSFIAYNLHTEDEGSPFILTGILILCYSQLLIIIFLRDCNIVSSWSIVQCFSDSKEVSNLLYLIVRAVVLQFVLLMRFNTDGTVILYRHCAIRAATFCFATIQHCPRQSDIFLC